MKCADRIQFGIIESIKKSQERYVLLHYEIKPLACYSTHLRLFNYRNEIL